MRSLKIKRYGIVDKAVIVGGCVIAAIVALLIPSGTPIIEEHRTGLFDDWYH